MKTPSSDRKMAFSFKRAVPIMDSVETKEGA